VIRNFARLQATPLGFDARGRLAVEVALPEESYAAPERRAGTVRRIVDEVRAAAGITSAACPPVRPPESPAQFP
jgi:hypothetical protein